MTMSGKLMAACVVTLAAMGIGGCEYHGNDGVSGIDNPIGRKVAWFSFLSAEDIKSECHPGSADRLRLVYNGRWAEQVRIYELSDKQPHVLDQRVIGPADLSHFDLALAIEPLTGRTAQSELAGSSYQSLIQAVDKAVAAAPPPVDATFASDSYYWTVAGCRQGRFVFNAWQYDSAGFNGLAFPPLLLAADKTGIAYNQPHAPDSLDLANKPKNDRERWYLRVYADRVGGAIGF